MSGQAPRDGNGCPPPHSNGDQGPLPACGHDCHACISDFESTQQRVEQLWAALHQEHLDHQQLWVDARAAFRQILQDLVPAPHQRGLDGDPPGFAAGWDGCRAEISERVEALSRVLRAP